MLPRKRWPYVLLLLAGLAWVGLVAGVADGRAACDFSTVESAIRADVESGKLPSVAFAIAEDGAIVHENAYGWADEQGQVRSSPDIPYPLASATKPFVATALMILSERGRLDLDAPAARYAQDWLSTGSSGRPAPDYTVRQLLTHTSGLGTYARIYWADQDVPVRSLADSFRLYGFTAQPPGTVSEYSNLGYGLLGHLIEKPCGRRLGQCLEHEVFEPLGLQHTMLVDACVTPRDAARKYDPGGAPLPDTCNDTPGAGNIYSSAHDLALFGAFHLSDRADDILSAAGKRTMRSFVEPGAIYPYYGSSHYGLGWYFRTTPEGEDVVWHEGGMPGASTILLLLPARNIAAAVVINANDVNARAEAFANGLIEAIEPDFHAVTFDATEGLTKFAGEPVFAGRWKGNIDLPGKRAPWAVEFAADGTVRAEFPGPSGEELLPPRAAISVLLKGDLLVGTFAATLPAPDVARAPEGYVLLRLLRRGDRLSGTAVAYASPSRLEHLLPFPAELRRAQP